MQLAGRITFWAALALFAWPFVQGTYLLYSRLTIRTDAQYEVRDATIQEELPAYRWNDLRRLGFSFAGGLERVRDHPEVSTKIAIFVNAKNADWAQLACIRSSLATRYLLIFATTFDDGLVLETSDARGRSIYYPKPKYPTFRFPGIRQADSLYLIHQRIKQEFTDPRQPVAVDSGRVLTDFMINAKEIHRLNLSQGDHKPSPSADRCRYTLKGALRHTCLRTWPVTFIREMLTQRDAERKCKELGLRIDYKFGRVVPLR